MGGKSAPSLPPLPDPEQIAQTDARFNRLDQLTPYGSLTFSGPDRNQLAFTLSPEMQEIFNQRTAGDLAFGGGALSRFSGLPSSPIDFNQFDPIQQGLGFNNTLPTDIGGFRGDVEQAVFDRGRRLLDPVFSDREEALTQSYASQGLPRGGEAQTLGFTRFDDSRNRAYQDLADQSIISGGQQASRMLADQLGVNQFNLGEAQTRLNANNLARLQHLQEQMGVRGQGLGEIAQLYGMGQSQQIPGLNSFFAPGQADVMGGYGLLQQQQQNNFNQQMARSNAGMGGLFGLGSAAILGAGGLGPLMGGIGGAFGGGSKGSPQPMGFPSGNGLSMFGRTPTGPELFPIGTG
jgi:hypothetical protein